MATCDKCAYDWEYSGDMKLATCPSCQSKTTTSTEGGGVCDICGDGENIHYHHVQYDPEEIVPLCRACHYKVHTDKQHPLYPNDPPDGVTLNERFTDEEFERLERGKGDRTWREALLDELAKGEKDG